MSSWFWADSHLDWIIFCVVVYSLLSLLVTDYAWRVIKVRMVVFLPVVFFVWGGGVLGLLLIKFG